MLRHGRQFTQLGAALLQKWQSIAWSPHSHLFIPISMVGWVLDEEARELINICRRIGIPVYQTPHYRFFSQQCLFLLSRYFLLDHRWLGLTHRIATPFYHGLPGTGSEVFDQCYEGLRRHHGRLSRIQVSNSQMRDAVLESGVDPSKVFLIPIGINLEYFPMRTPETRIAARKKWHISENAFVVASFQKDGNGWGEGQEPKLIKGPDVLINTVRILRASIPELFVLLSGPARGYVISNLEKLNIPYKHVLLDNYPDMASLYHASDVYLVTSRQEGGPKAVLESMATGVPLVTTRVGQAMDLVRHEQNAWMVDIEDHEGLAHRVEWLYYHSNDIQGVIKEGRKTAECNSYLSQDPLWRNFMQGFVG
jgi:glycosyltransferase involved in cell wall biosynthesis